MNLENFGIMFYMYTVQSYSSLQVLSLNGRCHFFNRPNTTSLHLACETSQLFLTSTQFKTDIWILQFCSKNKQIKDFIWTRWEVLLSCMNSYIHLGIIINSKCSLSNNRWRTVLAAITHRYMRHLPAQVNYACHLPVHVNEVRLLPCLG
jgi:hypothetical protein